MMTSSATAKLISDVTAPQGDLLLPKFKYHYPIVIGCYNLCYAVSIHHNQHLQIRNTGKLIKQRKDESSNCKTNCFSNR